MKIRILTILFIISLAFNLGFLAKVLFKPSAKVEPCEVSCAQPGWQGSAVCMKLDLSPQQIEQMEKARGEFQSQIASLNTELEKKRQALFHQLKCEVPDDEEINKIIQAISDSQGRVQKHFVHYFFQTRKIFSPEQQQKFYFYIQQCLCTNTKNGGPHCHEDSPGESESPDKNDGVKTE